MSIPFVHLHVHTSYSLLDGAAKIDQLIKTASALGQKTMAITDHGVMFGIVEFYKAAVAGGIKPILGCEVYVAENSRFDRKSKVGGACSVPSAQRLGTTKAGSLSNHLVLLAKDQAGYANLTKLVTAAQLEGFYYKPRIDLDILSQNHQGLIALSACLKGKIPEQLLAGDEAGAMNTAGKFADIMGKNNFYLEIQDHNLPDQKKVNPALIELARKTSLPLVATNDVHYLKKEHAAAHDVLLCLQTGTFLSDPKRMRYGSNEFYLKSGKEMSELFHDQPTAIANTIEIGHRCNVEFSFNEFHFPKFAVPGNITSEIYLRELCHEGVRPRYNIADPAHPRDKHERTIMERLDYEISVIVNTNFVDYFLVVWDFVRFAREHKIPVGPGRGSGAGSLVSYALGITGLDPLRYNLLFERFLNPKRISPPDFDIDFCQGRRQEVIDYVRGKYGRDNVAQIITFGSLGARTVIRDVGRVLQIPLPTCNRLAKMVPEGVDINLEKAKEQNPEFKKACREEPDARQIIQHATVLEGLFRHAGVHAAGVVISKEPLAKMIPLTKDKEGQIITQFSHDHVEALGLLKADFLGLTTLDIIDETLKLIEQTKQIKLDIKNIPFDDKETYALFQRGDTIGVFQLESRGMRDLVRRIGLNRIEDLIAMIALYRPGPMNMLDKYVECKTGRTKITYDNPLLEPILAETYGVLLYQEQVQQAAQVLAGFSLGDGDILRRAMGKKRPEEMEGQRQKFIEGCHKTSGLTANKAEKIFNNIAKFAGYGFNKSHSTGYAIIAFQTAYLKAHYPEEFLAALLSSEISGNSKKLPVFTGEARAMGLEILPPDINKSSVRFMPLNKAIRFGLAGIKNIGEGAAEAIVRERETHGPFQSLIDFCTRMDSKFVNRKILETLIRCGACDDFGAHRAQLFGAIDRILNRTVSIQRDRQSGQGNLFADLDKGFMEENLPNCEPWQENAMLSAEKELLGIYMSGHPLSQHEKLLKHYCLSTVIALAELEDGATTRIGGVIEKVDKKISKDNNPYANLRIEDIEGTLDVLVFNQSLQEYEKVLVEGALVLACGQISKSDDNIKMYLQEIYPLEDAPRLFAERLSIHLPANAVDDNLLGKIRELIKKHPGSTPVFFCLQFQKGEEIFIGSGNDFKVTPDESLITDLERIIGEESIYVASLTRPCRKAESGRKFNGMRRS
ncbi:DNA polymerase III subunit alpha [Verrucomicrobiota bacterium]